MEREFYNIHEKMCNVVATKTSHRFRACLENAILFLAVSSFCTVLLSHRKFVFRGGVIKMEAVTQQVPGTCLKSVRGFQEYLWKGFDVTHVLIGDLELNNSFVLRNHHHRDHHHMIGTSLQPRDEVDTCVDARTFTSLLKKIGGLSTTEPKIESKKYQGNQIELSEKMAIEFSFSEIEGFLHLPDYARKKHNITTYHIVVSPSDLKCFGDDPLLQYVIRQFMGQETVALNWILGLLNGNHAYIYNHRTSDVINIEEYLHSYSFHLPAIWSSGTIDTMPKDSRNTDYDRKNSKSFTASKWHHQYVVFKLGVLVSSLFLFFLTTTIVSFTLLETQQRMLNFTIQLNSRIRQREKIADLIITHVAENMVFVPIMIGIIFFLVHCFYNGDKFLAFIILSGVWICEVFSAISMRTLHSSIYFPQVFFAYFTLFHVYYFSCPFGFSYAALASTTLFLLHSMISFWFRYELPAIISGQVCRESPRMLFITPSPDMYSQQNTTVFSRTVTRDTAQDTPHDGEQNISMNRSSSRQRMARGMSYPSMSSLGRINIPSTIDFEDDENDNTY